jgi:hypothetical protein
LTSIEIPKKATRRNIFSALGDDTFGVSQSIASTLLESGEVSHTAVRLYFYLLSAASSPVVRLHTAKVLKGAGLSRESWATAREQQRQRKLIHAKETEAKGIWRYELLNATGGKLPTYDGHVKFDELSPEQIEAYYCDRLGVSKAGGQSVSGHLKFECPFHSGTPSKLTFTAVLDQGSTKNGVFSCSARHCRKHGGLIKFEQAISATKGLELSDKQAGQAVRMFMISRVHVGDVTESVIKHLQGTPAGISAI